MDRLTEPGRMPMVVGIWMIRHEAPEIGFIGEMWKTITSIDGDAKVEPDGWLLCDGKCYCRKDYPELAEICRQFTSWSRWHLGREFRVPQLRMTVGVDFG